MTRTKFVRFEGIARFPAAAVLLAALLVMAGCAGTPEDSTEVDGGVATTGDRDNFRYLRSRDMNRMQRENARHRDAVHAAARKEEAEAAAKVEAAGKAKAEAEQAKKDAEEKEEKSEDENE